MRITNGMITGNYLNNLYSNLNKMNKYQTQLATNSRITKLSDDPIGVLYSMQARVKLYRIEQYQKNVEAAQTWLTHTETAVLEMNDIIKTAYENVVSASNDFLSDADKSAIAELIGQLRDHVLSIGNNKNGDKYIFGGFNTGTAPFKVDDATGRILYNGIDIGDASNPAIAGEKEQVIRYEIGAGMKADVSVTGIELMSAGDENIYNVLDGLYNALKNNASAEEISSYADKLTKCQSNLMALEAEIGGRTNRLELVGKRYEDDYLNYSQMKANVEEIDPAEVIMFYKMAEAVYTAALQVGANIIQPSLVNFLD
jgi:flagellar hook-associated protein 3 FlgL